MLIPPARSAQRAVRLWPAFAGPTGGLPGPPSDLTRRFATRASVLRWPPCDWRICRRGTLARHRTLEPLAPEADRGVSRMPSLQAARPVLLHLGATGPASILHARQLPWQYAPSRPRRLCTRRQTCNSSHLPPAGFAAPRDAASAGSLTPSATRCAIRKGPGPNGNRRPPAGTAMAFRAPPAPR